MSNVVLSRTSMSPEERRLRSRIAQLVSSRSILHGTILDRKRKCGRADCRCASDPDRRHPAMYLFLTEGGRTRQLYVPREWHERVRQWVANDHELRRLARELSALHWKKVRERQS